MANQEQFSNAAQTTLNGAIGSGTNPIVVAGNTGFPTSAQFRILIDTEIMTVTAGQAGTSWTVTRNSEPYAGVSAAAAHANGAVVTHLLTAAALVNAITNLNPIANSYGLTISGPSTAGQSLGLSILAGTNSSDNAAFFKTQAGATILNLRGDQQSIFGGPIWTPPAVGVALPSTTYGTVANVIDYQTPAAAASVIIPAAGSLPTGYRHLRITYKLKTSTATTAENMGIQFNGSAVANYFDNYAQFFNGAATYGDDNNVLLTKGQAASLPGSTAPANSFGTGEIVIYDYNSTTDHKTYTFVSIQRRGTGASGTSYQTGGGGWVIAPVAITTITLIATGNLTGFVTTMGIP